MSNLAYALWIAASAITGAYFGHFTGSLVQAFLR
jgi:hypothetical protein